MGIGGSIRQAFRKAWFEKKEYTYHFIHIPKNGGYSVRYALAMCGEVSLSEPFHHRYVDIVDQVGADLRFFCTVRNPWSRTASRYLFGKQDAEKWPIDDPRRQYIQNTTFEAFVKERRILQIPQHPGEPWMGPLSSWFDQLEWIRDEAGNVVVDCLRLENVEKDISTYLNRDIHIRRHNVTHDRYDYRTMYTAELIQIVADFFSEDIEYFGFDFEGAATRNIATLD